MNNSYSNFSTGTTLRNGSPFHFAFTWLAELLTSIVAWVCLILL